MDYATFLDRKSQSDVYAGFEPLWMPSQMFDFQSALTDYALRKGKSAIFAGCGLGKTLIQLTWADNIVRKTNKRVLIVTPLAVSAQTIEEGEKFEIEAHRSKDGALKPGITITNYESLHRFSPNDFTAMVCDESGILKNYDATYKKLITDFMRKLDYRLLCTATPSPNDYIELGTSSEALGELGYMDMLGRFFKNEQNSLHPTSGRGRWERGSLSQNKWRFKGHAEQLFWQWVCSWARACNKPSDLGFDDGPFILPPLVENQTVVKANAPRPGMLFEMPAVGLKEQREELRHTLQERCEMAAEKVATNEQAISWCHLNDEADLLEKLIPDAKQVSGSQSDEEKEEIFHAFTSGQLRVMVTKPKIGAWGLNLQNCAHMTFFPGHSYEQWHQAVRRCWRFGQKRAVTVDVITTEGQADVLANLQRKSRAADRMFAALVLEMNNSAQIARSDYQGRDVEIPQWLS